MSERFQIPHKLRANGQVIWSDATVQEIMRKAGVSLDSRGVPRHPCVIYRVSVDEEGTATYEVRQGERA
jgi:hypothetical protein